MIPPPAVRHHKMATRARRTATPAPQQQVVGMRVLGIDPGTVTTGVGIIERVGGTVRPVHIDTIQASRQLHRAKRLHHLYQALTQTIECYQPDVIALENIFFHRDFRSAMRLGEARAMVLLAAAAHDLTVTEYPPARIKQAVCGNGRAAKTQIQYMVTQELALQKRPQADAADALAVALCYLFTQKQLQLVA